MVGYPVRLPRGRAGKLIWLPSSGHAADGHPLYGGWPAIYTFFLEKGISKAEVDETPLYNAFLCMGAISKDKIGLKMSERDGLEYRIAIMKKREGKT